jgi:hypothetical protein
MSSRKQVVKKQKRTHALLYGLSGLFLLIAAIVTIASRANAGVHPDPRSDAEQLATAPPELFNAYPEIKETYQMAAHVKSTLDGLFCYCHCKGAGHYSLLDCFRDEHGAGCDICLESARVAYRMANEGKSIDEIRTTIDQMFGKT